jgi:hypothetical protein
MLTAIAEVSPSERRKPCRSAAGVFFVIASSGRIFEIDSYGHCKALSLKKQPGSAPALKRP